MKSSQIIFVIDTSLLESNTSFLVDQNCCYNALVQINLCSIAGRMIVSCPTRLSSISTSPEQRNIAYRCASQIVQFLQCAHLIMLLKSLFKIQLLFWYKPVLHCPASSFALSCRSSLTTLQCTALKLSWGARPCAAALVITPII